MPQKKAGGAKKPAKRAAANKPAKKATANKPAKKATANKPAKKVAAKQSAPGPGKPNIAVTVVPIHRPPPSCGEAKKVEGKPDLAFQLEPIQAPLAVEPKKKKDAKPNLAFGLSVMPTSYPGGTKARNMSDIKV